MADETTTPMLDEEDLPTETEELHGELVSWVQEWADATVDERDLQLKMVRYRHGKQWTEQEESALLERGQNPVVINKVADKINFALGSEYEQRSDARCYPRTPDAHEVDASLAEDAINYEDDRLQLDYIEMEALEDLYTAGVGVVVFGNDDPKYGNFLIEHVPWDRFVRDPHSRKADFSDARFLGVVCWRQIREAKRDPRYKKGREIIDATQNSIAGAGGETFDDRPQYVWVKQNRVQIFELYYQERDSKGKLVWWYTHFTGAGFLIEPRKVPFLDDPQPGAEQENWCPVVATCAYIDEDGNRYGPIKHMISPQDEINKRRSKFLHLLSVRQVAVEESAVANDATLQEELAKPDGIVRLNNGGLSENRFQVLPTNDLAQGQFQLYVDAKGDLDAKGAQAAIVNAQIRDVSARSFLAQQEAGDKELGLLHANVYKFKLAIRTRIWWMIKQFRTREYWLRVRDTREGSVRFVRMNHKMTKREHVYHLVRDEGMPGPQALVMVGGPDAQVVYENAVKQLQQQVQQANQQAQQTAAQKGVTPPPTPPAPPEALDAAAFDIAVATPLFDGEFIANDVAKLDIDMVLDLVNESAVVEHEQFELLAELARHQVPIPPQVLIQASRLKDKRQVLAAMQPDPQQTKMQQDQMLAVIAKLQAEVMELQTQAKKNEAMGQAALIAAQAKAQTAQADVQRIQAQAGKFVAEAQAMPDAADKDHAAALKYAAEAGAVAAGQAPTRPAERSRRPGGE